MYTFFFLGWLGLLRHCWLLVLVLEFPLLRDVGAPTELDGQVVIPALRCLPDGLVPEVHSEGEDVLVGDGHHGRLGQEVLRAQLIGVLLHGKTV